MDAVEPAVANLHARSSGSSRKERSVRARARVSRPGPRSFFECRGTTRGDAARVTKLCLPENTTRQPCNARPKSEGLDRIKGKEIGFREQRMHRPTKKTHRQCQRQWLFYSYFTGLGYIHPQPQPQPSGAFLWHYGASRLFCHACTTHPASRSRSLDLEYIVKKVCSSFFFIRARARKHRRLRRRPPLRKRGTNSERRW